MTDITEATLDAMIAYWDAHPGPLAQWCKPRLEALRPIIRNH